MPCRFASSGTVATSRSASRAILALNAASNFLRDLVISVLHRLRQSRTLHTLTFGPISGVHFSTPIFWKSSTPIFPILFRPFCLDNYCGRSPHRPPPSPVFSYILYREREVGVGLERGTIAPSMTNTLQ